MKKTNKETQPDELPYEVYMFDPLPVTDAQKKAVEEYRAEQAAKNNKADESKRKN